MLSYLLIPFITLGVCLGLYYFLNRMAPNMLALLVKYSPYKILNLDQFNVAVQILTDLKSDLGNNNQSRSFIIDGGAGTGKSILGIYLLKLLIDAKSSPTGCCRRMHCRMILNSRLGQLRSGLLPEEC